MFNFIIMIKRVVLPHLLSHKRIALGQSHHVVRLVYGYSSKAEIPKQYQTQLQIYEGYLIKHNQAIKKPHQKLETEQKRIISSYLQQQKYSEVINFLTKNSHLRLCNINTSFQLDKYFTANFGKLSKREQNHAAFGLISFRMTNFFNAFRLKVEQKLKHKKMQEIAIEEFFVYLFGCIIQDKDVSFIDKIKNDTNKLSIEAAYQYLISNQLRGPFYKDYVNMKKYFEILAHPQLNRIEDNRLDVTRKTPLEIDVQSFISVLDLKFQCEAVVNNFKVDYLIEMAKGPIALEVNGSYHYTLANKLKGRDIVRNLIVNQGVPLRIVHHQDYLLSKGHRNKMAYIQNLLTNSEGINWQCHRKGMKSGWQVTQLEGVLS